MEKVVFAFDRDGTVSTGGGPVPIDVVRRLKEKHVVYAIGNAILCKEAGIPYAEGWTKAERLRWLRERFPDAKAYIVVDDVPITEAGWAYIPPARFVKVMNQYL